MPTVSSENDKYIYSRITRDGHTFPRFAEINKPLEINE